MATGQMPRLDLRLCAAAMVLVAGLVGWAWTATGRAAADAPAAPAQARYLFQEAYQLNQGEPTCPESVLRQKEFLYRKALEIAPGYREAWNNLGDVYENLGDYAQALEAYGKAVQLAPDWAPPLFGIADVHFRAGRWQESVEYYDRGLKLEPGDELSRLRRDFAAARLAGATDSGPQGLITAEEIVTALSQFTKRGLDGIVNAPSVTFGEAQVPFRTASAEILPEAKRQLAQIARALSDNRLSGIVFEVSGHTDERGAADYNQRLSVRRAEAVKGYLVRQGVEPARLLARGYGESRPIAFGHDAVSWAANRRVQITRLDQEDLAAAKSPRLLAMEFGVLHVAGASRRELIQSGKTVLRSGDTYQVYVHPKEECYVYLYQVDSSGKGRWLFPNEGISYDNPLRAGGEYWLPGGGRLFRLDRNPGTETIYLVASAVPATDLVFLIQQASAPSTETEGQFVKRGVGGVRAQRRAPDAKATRAPAPAESHRGQAESKPAGRRAPSVTLEGVGEFRWKVQFEHR